MSPFFNELINVYPEYFELGIIAPDKLFCDTTNHYYNCTPSPSGYHYGSVGKKNNKGNSAHPGDDKKSRLTSISSKM